MKQWYSEYDTDGRQHDGQHDVRQHNLLCGTVCTLSVLSADIEGTDDGSADCQRLEYLNHKHIDCIDQGNRGDCRTSASGDHDRIHHAHQCVEQLLGHKRDQETAQCLSVKQQISEVNL